MQLSANLVKGRLIDLIKDLNATPKSKKDKIDGLRSILLYLDEPNAVDQMHAQYAELIRRRSAITKQQDDAAFYYGMSNIKIIDSERSRVGRALGLEGISYKISVLEKILF
jgi:hypothetical protein